MQTIAKIILFIYIIFGILLGTPIILGLLIPVIIFLFPFLLLFNRTEENIMEDWIEKRYCEDENYLEIQNYVKKVIKEPISFSIINELPEKLYNDRLVITKLLEKTNENNDYDTYNHNQIIKLRKEIYNKIGNKLTKNYKFINKAIDYNDFPRYLINEKVLQDKNTMYKILSKYPEFYLTIDEKYRKKEKIIALVLKQKPSLYKYIPISYKKDVDFVYKLINEYDIDQIILEYANIK